MSSSSQARSSSAKRTYTLRPYASVISERTFAVRPSSSANRTRRNITVSLPKAPLTQREAKTDAEKISQLVEQFEEFEKIDKFLTNMLKNARTDEEKEAIKYDKKELHAMEERMAENNNPNIEVVKEMIGFWKRKVGMLGGKKRRMGGTKRRGGKRKRTQRKR